MTELILGFKMKSYSVGACYCPVLLANEFVLYNCERDRCLRMEISSAHSGGDIH